MLPNVYVQLHLNFCNCVIVTSCMLLTINVPRAVYVSKLMHVACLPVVESMHNCCVEPLITGSASWRQLRSEVAIVWQTQGLKACFIQACASSVTLTAFRSRHTLCVQFVMLQHEHQY